MDATSTLSRRERQIMDVLFARGSATAAEIGAALPDGPGNSSVRTLLRVLEDKGHVTHREVGRVYEYAPTVPLERARRSALSHLLDTFFAGSVEGVVATLLSEHGSRLEPDAAERIARLVDDAREKGR
jgi:predicted transcriptional regulator